MILQSEEIESIFCTIIFRHQKSARFIFCYFSNCQLKYEVEKSTSNFMKKKNRNMEKHSTRKVSHWKPRKFDGSVHWAMEHFAWNIENKNENGIALYKYKCHSSESTKNTQFREEEKSAQSEKQPQQILTNRFQVHIGNLKWHAANTVIEIKRSERIII